MSCSGLRSGLDQRVADFLRIGGAGAIDRLRQRQKSLYVTPGRVVEIAAGFGLIHFIDSLILYVVEPGLPMSQALRFIRPRPISLIAGTKDGSENPLSSPSTIGGRKSIFLIVLM